jgi:hypothetical protein
MTDAVTSPSADRPGRFAGGTKYQEQEEVKPRKATAATWLVLLIFFPFLIEAFVYLKLLLEYIFVRNDAAYPEGANVYAFLTSFHTGMLYSAPLDFPLNVQPYGPLFYVVGAIMAKIAHGDPMLTTQLMRSVSFASYLGCVALIAYLCWRLERSRRWTLVAVILGLACTWAVPFASRAGSDAQAIFLIIVALTLYEVAEGRGSVLFFAGVVGSLSFLSKQSTAPVLLVLVVDCLIARRFRQALIFIAGGVPAVVLMMGALWLRHEPFLTNLTAVGHAYSSWATVIPAAVNLIRTNQLAIIPICVALLGAVVSWRKEKYRAILLVVAIAWLSNVAALENTGGYGNYLMLPWLSSILLVPAGLERLEQWAERSILIPAALIVLGTFLFVHQRNLVTQKLPVNLDTSNTAKLNILTDLPYLEVRSGRPQLFDPFYYRELSRQNLWSDAPIMQQIRGKEFDLLLLTGKDGPTDAGFQVAGFRGTSYWGADELGEMMVKYQVLCEVSDHIALVPRDRADALRPEDLSRIFREPCKASSRQLQLRGDLQ